MQLPQQIRFDNSTDLKDFVAAYPHINLDFSTDELQYPFVACELRVPLCDLKEGAAVLILMSIHSGPGDLYYDKYHRRIGKVLWTLENGRIATVKFEDGCSEQFLRSEVIVKMAETLIGGSKHGN
jgi:hypothetical protein